MLKPLVLLLPVLLLGAAPVIDRPVVDMSGRLSPADTEAIATELVRLRQETGAQMAVLMVDTTQGVPISDYANEAARAWRGGERGRDNGLLLVLAVGDRRQRLEVGYGLEEYLPDGAVRTLLDAQGPLLRQGDYRGALLAVVSGVRLRLPGAQGSEYREPWGRKELGTSFIGLLFGGLIVGALLGLCVGLLRKELGTVNLALAVGALVLLPPVAVVFSVQASPLPTWQFLLTYALLTGVFFLLMLVASKTSAVLAGLLSLCVVLAGLAMGSGASATGVLELLLYTAVLGGVPSLFVFGIWAAIRSNSSQYSSSGSSWGGSSSSSWSSSDSSSSSWSSSDSSSSWSSSDSSSSSSSDSSWSGGGGDFGGGGSDSSW